VSQPIEAEEVEPQRNLTQKILDVVEKAGNKVPHPAVIFLILVGIVVVLSHVLYMAGASISYQALNPETHKPETATAAARSLLTAAGIRFIYSTLVPSFMSFTAVGLMIAAMVGVGVAEEAGLMKTLIRKLVLVASPAALTYILAFVGILASVAGDAAYLVLIPLAGAAFISVGRHPLAGLALGFAAVAGSFNVNLLIKPLDAVFVEFTNDAIRLVNPNASIGLTSNLWFSIASVVFLTVVIALITERVIEPRLGTYKAEQATTGQPAQDHTALSANEARGLRFAAWGLVGVVALFALLTLPPGAPLRSPDSGDLIGNSPFMNGLIAVIMMLFLATGVAYGFGAGTMTNVTDVIKAIEKSLSGLGSLIFLFLVISQFVAYFSFSNMGTIVAVKLADVLQDANIGPLWLLIGFMVVVGVVNLALIPGAIAKWAIFAPIFVPLLMQFGVTPEAVLAAYRVGDSPTNAITPLNPYFALVVGFAQKYEVTAGVGTIVSLMLPYVLWMFVLWTFLFAVWYLLGLPWGL
jgi:aminobenzoyl-glutamate transport protein